MMNKFIALAITVIAFSACTTKYNYIDTGVSCGVHNCTVYEYLKTDSYNWDTLRKMIVRANLVDLFDGKADPQYNPENKHIMVFGLTNHTLRDWMYRKYPFGTMQYPTVNDIPIGICRALILQHVVRTGVMYREDVPIGLLGTGGAANKGGIMVKTILSEVSPEQGEDFWFWAMKSSWEGVPEAGPRMLYLCTPSLGRQIDVASADIVMTNGVVHALNYSYKIDLKKFQ